MVTMIAPVAKTYVFAQSTSQSQAPLSDQQLNSLVSPIALYPHSLISQILMASTYPLEVAEAAGWQKQNSRLTGPALDGALQSQNWDPSVKSLVSFPQALQMMGSDLNWTQKLGDAVLAQQSDVMKAIQTMRAKAKQAGNLTSTPQQTVSTSGQNIIIQPASPQVIYVPTHNPTVVYGPWPYPAYPPPPPYYPPGYVAGAELLSFGIGMAVGAALFGGMHWGGGWDGGSITVNNNTFNSFNRNTANGNFKSGSFSSGDKWQFNPQHRGNMPYPNSNLQSKYGKLSNQGSSAIRDQERDHLRQNLEKNGLNGTDAGRSEGSRDPGRDSSHEQAARNDAERARDNYRAPERDPREGGFGGGERAGGRGGFGGGRMGGFRR
ncbi:DUF3300 domain-containing protein [Polynucleobacter necessarius]|uniref:DUF3300 domain-containing protein n=1 Tax=Polynucleobacter necessarius TaxID=576610 RepID=UPI0013B05B8F|nr:DUF3300 domain-containing protein [Polynucleobacter necessarius]